MKIKRSIEFEMIVNTAALANTINRAIYRVLWFNSIPVHPPTIWSAPTEDIDDMQVVSWIDDVGQFRTVFDDPTPPNTERN